MACPDHNFNATRPPGGDDDPCNTSGEGIFEPGSYWLDTSGDCPRLYVRTGENCGVAEWLEIPTSSARFEASDPGPNDCCPSGTIWVNTATDAVYISYTDMDNDPPNNCNWCTICDPIASACVTADGVDFVIIDPAGTPTGTQILGLLPINVVVNNPNQSRAMPVTIHWSGSMLFVNSNGVGGPPALIGHDQVRLDPVFTVDGAAVFNPFARNAGYSVNVFGLSYNRDVGTQGWTGCHTIPAGGSVTVDLTETLEVIENVTISDIIIQGGTITVSSTG